MPTKYIHRRGFVIPAANHTAANTILQRQGFGSDNFCIPLVLNIEKDIVRETDNPVSVYVAYFTGMTDVQLGIIQRKLADLGIREYNKEFQEVLVDEVATRESTRYEYKVAIVIRATNRAAIITALTPRYADADTRFFKSRLSTTGVLPVQAYGDRWQVDRSFGTQLKTFCDSFPRSEVWIWCKNQDALRAAKLVFDKPEYQDPNSITRLKARVQILQQSKNAAEILTELGLKVIPNGG